MADGSSNSNDALILSNTASPKPPLLRQPGPGLFFGGVVFAVFSAVSTRRALRRRTPPILQTATPPLGSASQRIRPLQTQLENSTTKTAVAASPENRPDDVTKVTLQEPPASSPASEPSTNSHSVDDSQPPPGPILALEALSLATINVFSWAMVLTGLTLWSFDIQGLDDLRRKVRGGLGVDGTGRSENEVEEELEEWVVGVLARQEGKERLKDRVTERKQERVRGRRNGRGRYREVDSE